MVQKSSKPSMPGMRIFSYSVAGVLGLLLMSSTLNPILSDSSERAVINAPVRLVTSPIKGVLEGLTIKPGDEIQAGDVLAVVNNQSIDRSKLIELDLKVSDLASGIETHNLAIAEGKAVQERLQRAIAEQRAALMDQFAGQVDSGKANLAKFEAQQAIAETSHDRELKLKSRGVVGGDLVTFEKASEAAVSEKIQAFSEVQASENRLAAAQRDIYLGPDSGTINSLAEELRASQRQTNEAMIEVSGLKAMVEDISKIRDLELNRIAQLSRHEIVAAGSGAVLEVGGSNGSMVSEGDAIAQSMGCDTAFVVAIFSERKAQALFSGAPVTISGDSWDRPVKGTILKLVPRTTSIGDEKFAVPFPPTERRELYAYVKMADEASLPETESCQVGKWVSVSLDGGMFSSSSDAIGAAASAAGSVYAGLGSFYASSSEALTPSARTVQAAASQLVSQFGQTMDRLVVRTASALGLDPVGTSLPSAGQVSSNVASNQSKTDRVVVSDRRYDR